MSDSQQKRSKKLKVNKKLNRENLDKLKSVKRVNFAQKYLHSKKEEKSKLIDKLRKLGYLKKDKN